MAGLLNLLPRYLPRWVAFRRPLVLVLFLICVFVTWICNASSPPILEKGEPFPRVICIHALFCSHYKFYL